MAIKIKALLLSLISLLGIMQARADVTINETNFPDENFRNYLLWQSYGSDGVITDAEIAGITDISVSNRAIRSLKGIEFFTALTSLDCSYNQLTWLDVSKNPALTSLDCWFNQLTTLEVSGCTVLRRLMCYQNLIKGRDMDALVESLPNLKRGAMHVIWFENEGNEMTTTQVAVVRAKGWHPYYTDDGRNWLGYNGSVPSGIEDLKNSKIERLMYFDLQGRPVKGTSKRGVYIKDGRKVIR